METGSDTRTWRVTDPVGVYWNAATINGSASAAEPR